MAENKKMSKLQITLLSAAVASGLVPVSTALADDNNVSQKDMLEQAVALYEKLSEDTVAVPTSLANNCGSQILGKAVMLGFTSTDEASSVSDSVAIRKQDALTILYKTIISYDYSYALSSDEIDEIMNRCYDNALVDEENRAAYAFMLKHDIITEPYETEPDKLITWDSCRILVDVLYDLFVQETSFTVGDNTISMGAGIKSVTDQLGEPTRIDASDYDFDWYVYNSDPHGLVMVGVKQDRICAFFTNSADFSFGDIKSGDDYLLAYKYMENDDFRIFKNSDGTINAVMYNPYTKSDVTLDNSTYLRACELVDIINSYRASQGLSALNIDNELYSKANDMVSQPKYHALARDNRYSHVADDAQHEEGYDVFQIYQKLLDNDSECFDADISSIGISTYADEDFDLYASIVCSKTEAVLTTEPSDISEVEPDAYTFETVAKAELSNSQDTAEFVFETGTDETHDTTSELIVPTISAPINESTLPEGKDVIIKLDESVSDEYYVSIYSIEDDEYIVNSYIKTTGTELSFTKDLFTAGKDYKISVSSANGAGTSDACEITVRYGEVPSDALTLITPTPELSTDNDYLDIEWSTGLYHNFVLDIYSEDGKLMLSEVINDTNKVTVNKADPGTYYVYVTAYRNSDDGVIKAQTATKVTVTLPEPVITEYILEDGEKFYPIYEDEEMGLLYFYDEEIVEVDELANNGTTVKRKKKKITEKQVKDVQYYRALSRQQQRVEVFTGSTSLTLNNSNSDIYTYNGSQMSIYDDDMGKSVIEEAEKYLGVPYVWGGTTPKGFDCSGFVQYVYSSLGVELPRVSQDQVNVGMPLTREQLMPGDLVFFADNGDVHHVGIYVGDGYMIHAPYTGAVISYQSIDTPYYKSQFCGGRRVY